MLNRFKLGLVWLPETAGQAASLDWLRRLSPHRMAFLALMVLTGGIACAKSYYVSSVNGADTNPGTLAAPWKTVHKVNDFPFEAGDIVHFERGSTFSGGFTVSSSGLPGKPITLRVYGTQASPPRFSNPDGATLDGNAIRLTGSYIIIDGLYFHDCAAALPGPGMPAFGTAPIPSGDPFSDGAVFIAAGGNHNVIRNIEVTRSQVGIRVAGQNCLITRNYIHDNSAAAGSHARPAGIAVDNSDNEVSYNRIVDNGTPDKDDDAVAVLLDDRRYGKNGTHIHHNYSLRNGRFIESVRGPFSFQDLVVAYNVSDEYGSFCRIASERMSGGKLENNTIILTRGAGESAQPRAAIDLSLLGRATSMLAYRNNIFYLGPNYQVSPHTAFPHDHNLYYRTDGSTEAWSILGSEVQLGTGDKIGNPRFIDFDTEYARNPGGFRDLRLRNNSPAVDAGAPLGYRKDHDDNPVPTGAGPDMGAYEQGDLLEAGPAPHAIREAAEGGRWKAVIPASKDADPSGGAYYLDSAQGSDTNPGTKAQPWKTLRHLSDRGFQPGDTIYLARGSTFVGGVLFGSWGKPGRPITLTAYGRGAAPHWSNPDYNVLNGNAIQIAGSYIVVEELYFHHCATPPGRNRGASQKVGAVFILPGAHHNIVRNCEITKSPMCIHIYGQYNLVTHNYIHDNDEWPNPGWYAVGIMICNSNNEASYNLITNCWQPSPQYGGGDGGALEIDDRTYPHSNIYIHHNRTWANQGFLETVGGWASVEDNVVVTYNVSDDYQSFILCGNCSNFRVENNTVIRILNNGSWNGVFRFGRTFPASIRNNIFVVANACRVFEGRDTGTALQMHDHNLFFSMDTVPAEEPQGRGVPLGQGELIADPLFVDFGARDLHLREGSPAIGAGTKLGHAFDFESRAIPFDVFPELGAYQKSK